MPTINKQATIKFVIYHVKKLMTFIDLDLINE
jgi:hypothetical protein